MRTQVASPAAPSRAKQPAPRRGGGSHKLSAGDKGVLAVMVGIPTLIQLILVWIPMVLSIALSLTKWNALALSDIKSAGLSNYDFVLNNYPPFWPAVEHFGRCSSSRAEVGCRSRLGLRTYRGSSSATTT